MNISCSTIEQISSVAELLIVSDIIMVDTCSLIHDGFREMLSHGEEQFIQNHRKLFVLHSAVSELEKLTITGETALRKDARCTLDFINVLIKRHLLIVVGESQNALINDAQIMEYILRYRSVKRIAVITQDNDLTEDLFQMNQLKSFQGNELSLFRFNKNHLICRQLIA